MTGSISNVTFSQVARELGVSLKHLHLLRQRGVIKEARIDSWHRWWMSLTDRVRVRAELGDTEARQTVAEFESRLSKREDVG